jgi:MHS family proline/betaine transporter-like MFS transporter
LLGLLPTYAQVGMLAPILLILIRLLQGLSVGGEFSSSATYLVETAPQGRRGLTGSWANIGSMTGSLLGVGAAALVTNLFDADTLGEWAWRLPFLGGALLGATAIFMRRNLRASERFEKHDTTRDETSPLLQAFTDNLHETLMALTFAASYGICFYICFVYLPEWLSGNDLLDRGTALSINTAMTLLVIPLMPLAAVVGDKVMARRTWIALAILGLGVVSWPLHNWMLASGGSLVSVIVFHLVTFSLLAIPLGSGPALFVEMFPESDRLSGYSVAFNIGMGVFGGLTPMIATSLIAATGLTTAPAIYMTCACAFAVLCLSRIPDRSRDPLR